MDDRPVQKTDATGISSSSRLNIYGRLNYNRPQSHDNLSMR